MLKDIEVGVKVNGCNKCDKYNKAIEIHNMFSWECCNMKYDKETKEILIAEEDLMHIIQMVNPIQEVRNIKIIRREEMRNIYMQK